jgi:hypothetical protein
VTTEVREELTELEYLQLFYQMADFGPADGDVRRSINRHIQKITGFNIPPVYRDEGFE